MRELEHTPITTDGDPLAQLERAFIEDFLQQRGHTRATVRALPVTDAHALLTAASSYASGRLAELESRAHYVRDIHDSAEAARASGHRRGAAKSSE